MTNQSQTTTTATTTARAADRPRPVVQRWHTSTDAVVAVVAAGSAALVWAVARAAGVALEVKAGTEPSEVNVVSVLVTSVVVAGAGAGLLRMLERRTTRARRVWTLVAVVVWAVSFAGPLSATQLSGGAVLAGLHLLVGAVVIVGLRRTHPVVPGLVLPARA